MDKDLDNILKSIKSLSKEEQVRVLYFLQEEQMKNLSPKEQEIVSFMSEHIKKLETWNMEVKKLLQKNKEFFDELKRSEFLSFSAKGGPACGRNF